MKLLFLNTNIGYGGASKMIVWVANQFANNGYDVTLLTYRDKEVRQHIVPCIKLVQVQLEDVNGKGNIFASIKWIHKFIKNYKFDVGVAFLPPSILRLAIASKYTNMKVIFSHRGDPYSKRSNTNFALKVIDCLNSWAFEQADGYVFQTKMAQAYYSQLIRKKSVVIPNSIHPMRRTEKREGNIRKSFVAIGRLDLKQKRQDLLINAFNQLLLKYPEFTLEIYGDGKDETLIKEMAALNPNILLMGKTDDVVGVMQNAWAAVLSSDFEGIPNALLESMSLGVPSISTDCSPGGAAMLISNMENGILTPRSDAKALSEAMEYMITHQEEAEAMGKKGMEVNNLYAEGSIAKQWLEFIDIFK